MSSLVDAALRYAAAGIAVVPLHTPSGGDCSCRQGRRCESPGKHPRLKHGILEASTDATHVRSWWKRWPQANIGLATGTTLDVCDVDTNTGLRAVLDVLDVVRPDGPLVRTGCGWHLWFASEGLPSRVGFMPDVDWRGRGGSAVAPPSLHANGSRYRFAQPWTGLLPSAPLPLRQVVVPAPQPVVTAGAAAVIDVDRYARAALEGEVRRILDAPRPVYRGGERICAGGRNAALNAAAFRLGQLAAGGGLDAASVWPQLTDAALAADLPLAEARRTIESGWRAGLRLPRR